MRRFGCRLAAKLRYRCVRAVKRSHPWIFMQLPRRAVIRTIAFTLLLPGLDSGPLAAQQAPPPPPNAQQAYPPPNAQPTTPPPAVAPTPQSPQYSSNEIIDAGHRFFGGISRGLAQIVEKAGSQWGLPNGYVLGQEAGGAVGAGGRCGEGIPYPKEAGGPRVLW